MHQHVMPVFLNKDEPILIYKNCGCRYPEKSHCVSCHRTNSKYKIKKREDQCSLIDEEAKCNHDNNNLLEDQIQQINEANNISSKSKRSQRRNKNKKNKSQTLKKDQNPNSKILPITQDRTELDYLFVIDLECTCDELKRLEIQEIIEFPIIVVDLKQGKIIDTFHKFVKPTIYPVLTKFCTNLTSITQKQVDSSDPIQIVLQQALTFMNKYIINNNYNKVSILNDCSSDMANFLQSECNYKNILIHPIFKQYINLRRIYPLEVCERPYNIDVMLQSLQLQFEGVKHRGLDDAVNIARASIQLQKLGYIYNSQLKDYIYSLHNIHFYEHLIILNITIKLKNFIEISSIIFDLRSFGFVNNSFIIKTISNSPQSIYQEIQDYLNNLAIDSNNAAFLVNNQLHNQLKSLYSIIPNILPNTSVSINNLNNIENEVQKSSVVSKENLSSNSIVSDSLDNSNRSSPITQCHKKDSIDLIDNLSTCSSCSGESEEIPADKKVELNTNLIEENKYVKPFPKTSFIQDSLFVHYFSLEKINVLPPFNCLPFEATNLKKAQQEQLICLNNFINFIKQNNYFQLKNTGYDSNVKQANQYLDKLNQCVHTSESVNKLHQMCQQVQKALQQGFIFTTDYISTVPHQLIPIKLQ